MITLTLFFGPFSVTFNQKYFLHSNLLVQNPQLEKLFPYVSILAVISYCIDGY